MSRCLSHFSCNESKMKFCYHSNSKSGCCETWKVEKNAYRAHGVVLLLEVLWFVVLSVSSEGIIRSCILVCMSLLECSLQAPIVDQWIPMLPSNHFYLSGPSCVSSIIKTGSSLTFSDNSKPVESKCCLISATTAVHSSKRRSFVYFKDMVTCLVLKFDELVGC